MHSIDMLTNAFPKQDAVHRVFDDMIGWPHFVGGGLLRLLKDRDPVTLVILAHYGVALSAFNDCWWLEGGWGPIDPRGCECFGSEFLHVDRLAREHDHGGSRLGNSCL